MENTNDKCLIINTENSINSGLDKDEIVNINETIDGNEEQNKNPEDIDEYLDEELDESLDEDICSICITDFNENDILDYVYCPRCEKPFHLQCIIKWLSRSKTCPNCREKNIRIQYLQNPRTQYIQSPVRRRSTSSDISIRNLRIARYNCCISLMYYKKYLCGIMIFIICFILMIMIIYEYISYRNSDY